MRSYPVRSTIALLVFACMSVVLMTGCGSSAPDDDLKRNVVDNYAAGVHHLYSQSLESAMDLDEAIDRFLADPTPGRLEAAKRMWISARDDYGPTEAFRFYDGPIDDPESGPEGLINAWPLDEAYIDYVEGDSDAGIINSPSEFPVINADLLVELNEQGGEENVSTGWHAIEFLLWGQDMDPDGPGARPVEDYTTNRNAGRRTEYLSTASDLLVTHLREMVEAWTPGRSDNYRAEFVSLDTDEAIRKIITGIGELSRGELAGERMTVAYEERSQEDEHSCFSDNTTADIVANAIGIQMVYLGDYGEVSGPGIYDLTSKVDEGLANRLRQEIKESVNLTSAIPGPFAQHLLAGISDQTPGRQSVLSAIVSLEKQTDTIVSAAEAIGITISVS